MNGNFYEIGEPKFGNSPAHDKKDEQKTRKSKRYGIEKRINVEFSDHFNGKKEQKVKLKNISKTGALIQSRYYLEDEIIIKLSERVKIESKIIRRGIDEIENQYFYGIVYNEPFSTTGFNELIKEDMCYDYERCCNVRDTKANKY